MGSWESPELFLDLAMATKQELDLVGEFFTREVALYAQMLTHLASGYGAYREERLRD